MAAVGSGCILEVPRLPLVGLRVCDSRLILVCLPLEVTYLSYFTHCVQKLRQSPRIKIPSPLSPQVLLFFLQVVLSMKIL
jgi:hypothetical protein